MKARQRWTGALAGALLAASLGLALLKLHLGLGQTLLELSYDLPFHFRPVAAPTEAVLVYLDEASHADLRQPYSRPWDRAFYARLLERLTAEHARAVGFDILFSDPNTEHPEGDERFARALQASGKVVLGGDYTPDAEVGWTFIRGLELFKQPAVTWGMVQLPPDEDFEVRRHFALPANPDDSLYSSLSWQLAKVAGCPLAQDPDERARERWVNYYGPPGTIPSVSIELALTTNAYCPAGYFSNKIVLVGSSIRTKAAGERKDELRTPYCAGGNFSPAVDVQVTQTLNLIRGDWLSRMPRWAETWLVLLAGLLAGAGLTFLRPLPALAAAVAGALVLTAVAFSTFAQHRFWFLWMPIVAAQIPAALLWSVTFNSVQLYIQNRLYEQSLRMYLPPSLVKKFAGNKDLLKPGAEKHVLTLFFSDVADFTSLSEGMDPEELATLMNTYFQAAVGECIHRTEGTVAKYLGDGIFAFWNAPDPQPDHGLRACQAALRFRELKGRPICGRHLHTRVGLHTGPVNVGNFGSADRVDYTALGENVNLASRLEGLNKYLGTDCLVSGQTRSLIGDKLVTRPLGSFRLKGFAGLVEVHELVGWPEQAEESRPWREAFAQALSAYEQRHLELAAMGFQQVLHLRPNDGPAQFYLKQIAERTKEPQAEEWATYTVLKEK
jgi:adenylate cyclase